MATRLSREAARDYSPRRKPWVEATNHPAPQGRKTCSEQKHTYETRSNARDSTAPLNTHDRQLAERAHNHNWELDPVTRSLLDTDFYKLLMLQFIWKHYPKTKVSFSLSNRTTTVRLADMVPREELVHQMEHARRLRFRRSEIVWLAGNTFYGRSGIFEPAFLEWLERDFRLSDYELSINDGQFHLAFDGLWTETTMWELYALSILDELKTRAAMKKLREFGLDILYARAKTKPGERSSACAASPDSP